MNLLHADFFENRSKKWWLSLSAFMTLFFIGASQEFDGMILDNIRPASETAARYPMMLFCFLLLLVYLVPFIFFVRYSCRRMNVSHNLALASFFFGWFVPGWIAGMCNDGMEQLLRVLTTKSFVDAWGDAITAPIVEETLKVLTVVWLLSFFAIRRRREFLITGMCAGMGFQISEDLSYIEMQTGGSHKDFIDAIPFTLSERVEGGLVSHWCYTAVMAVAVWLIFYRKKRKQGIALLLVPVINHFLWDSPIAEIGGNLATGILSAWMLLVFMRVWARSLSDNTCDKWKQTQLNDTMSDVQHHLEKKGTDSMRIAAAINNDDENFFWHFGHCERFKLYDVEDGKVISTSYITVTGGHGPQRLQAMIENQVDVILSDGMGPGIAQAAPQFNLQIVAGVKGDADTAVQKYLAGELTSDEAAVHPCGQD